MTSTDAEMAISQFPTGIVAAPIESDSLLRVIHRQEDIIVKLRRVLVDYVGCDGKEDLGRMALAVKANFGDASSKEIALKAIQTLIETYEH